jgi:benzylsuccinate CoA-transferase BbsF subunit
MSKQALEGVKVADFTWVAAGPLTTNYLAQCGATVVKIESITKPDGIRTFPPNKDNQAGPNRSLLFSMENANKLSMTLNLKHSKGLEIAKRLVAWADIVAENYRPGTMARWGLGYEDLKKINPSIIMFSSSAQGQTGPDAGMGATGITLQSLSGFTHLTGWPDRDPAPPWGAYTDLTAPAFGAAALMAALDYRDRTGKGQYLDLSQYEAGLHYLSPAILDYHVNGRIAGRTGNARSYAAPHGVYRCSGEERWCCIAIFNEKEWMAFRQVIGEPGWTKEERFSTFLKRKENEAELNELVETWTSRHSPEDVMDILQKRGISAGVVKNAQDIDEDPQLKEREFLKKLDHPEIGPISHRSVGFKLSRTPCGPVRPGPCLGEHTEQVCREFLGMSDEEFVDLITAGVFE